ncbi:glycine-rich protein 5-like [Harmonia axyridis]|uniref:glycine-rich protein 5-like n=1 Tax=Harmonia axyridis TaxID=115357 RepID=UPI001E277986|nr:glycine-rich protein 5-like [Harmonia axyridis]
MLSTSLSAPKLFFLLLLITITIALKNGMDDNLDAIFRPSRSRNMRKTESLRATESYGLAGLIGEGQKKADCYRGGYRTSGGGGTGGGPPIIIIGGGGANGVIPGAGGAIPGAGGAFPGAGGAIPGAGGAIPGAGGTAAGGTGGFPVPAAAASGTASGVTAVPTA